MTRRDRLRAALNIVAAICALIATPHRASAELGHARAPGFKLQSLTGARLDLDQLRSHGPVLLDFWATWCKPCLTAIPELEMIHKEFSPRGLTVIGVSTDGPRSFSKVRPFVARQSITYPIALDEDGNMQQKYQVRAMPMTVLIDTAGTIVNVSQGFRPGEGSLVRAAIMKLLPAPLGATEAAPADSAAADSAAGTVR
jgi:peroxiredoxin